MAIHKGKNRTSKGSNRPSENYISKRARKPSGSIAGLAGLAAGWGLITIMQEGKKAQANEKEEKLMPKSMYKDKKKGKMKDMKRPRAKMKPKPKAVRRRGK